MSRAPTLRILAPLAMAALVGVVGCGGDDGSPEPQPEDCEITITSTVPASGDVLTAPPPVPEGDRLDIRWEARGGGRVRIDLLKGGTLQGVIDADTPNDGYDFWYVDDSVSATGDDYRVEITHLSADGCSDRGDAFTIVDLRDCAIATSIRYPGDETGEATAGDQMNITWTASGTTGSYDVELWWEPIGVELIGVIAQGVTGNALEGGWTIDSFNNGTRDMYFVQVTDAEYGTCYGRSDHFRLVDNVICELEILAPASSGPFFEGQDLDIVWTATNSTGLLDIELWYGEADRIALLATEVDASDETWTWTVDDYDYTGQSTQNYKIRLIDSDDAYCEVFSDRFEIRDPR